MTWSGGSNNHAAWALPVSPWGPAAAPIAPQNFDELIRRRARSVSRAAIVCAIAAAVLMLGNWLSLDVLGHPVAGVFVSMLRVPAFGVLLISGIFLIGNVAYALRSLSDRAIAHRPQLSRSATDIRAMHTWPVRNIPGPVVILAETGVAPAMGPGRFIWYLSCVLWPISVVAFIVTDLFKPTQQALVLMILAAVGTAITAQLLNRILAPEELQRTIPAADTARSTQPAFWTKGIIEPNRPQGDAPEVTLPIDDVVEDYYRRS